METPHSHNIEHKGIEWEAPARPYIKHPSYYLRFLIVMGFVISCILLLLRDYMFIVGVWMVVFVLYVRNRTKPEPVKYRITDFGVYWFGDIVPYINIHAFSFVAEHDVETLRIYNESNGIVYLSLVLPDDEHKKKAIREYLEQKVPYLDEPPKGDLERVSSWISRLFGF